MENTFLEFKVPGRSPNFFIVFIFEFENTFVGIFPKDKCMFKFFNKITKITSMDVVLETLLMTLNRCLSMAGILDYVRWFPMNIFLLHDAQVKK